MCEHCPVVEELTVELRRAQRLINILSEVLDWSETRTKTETAETNVTKTFVNQYQFTEATQINFIIENIEKKCKRKDISIPQSGFRVTSHNCFHLRHRVSLLRGLKTRAWNCTALVLLRGR